MPMVPSFTQLAEVCFISITAMTSLLRCSAPTQMTKMAETPYSKSFLVRISYSSTLVLSLLLWPLFPNFLRKILTFASLIIGFATTINMLLWMLLSLPTILLPFNSDAKVPYHPYHSSALDTPCYTCKFGSQFIITTVLHWMLLSLWTSFYLSIYGLRVNVHRPRPLI